MPLPSFGSAYDKARRAYGFCSALLLAWELIGIEVNDPPVEKINISLKAPETVPYVLIALVLYFGFRFVVEWYQAGHTLRRLTAARVDFVVSHIIGLAALSLYAIQTILQIQVVREFPWWMFMPIIPGVFLGLAVSNLTSVCWLTEWNIKFIWQKNRHVVWISVGLFTLSLVPILAFYQYYDSDMVLITFIVAFILPTLNALAFWGIRRGSLLQKDSKKEQE